MSPAAKPTNKVTAVGLAGALATIIAWAVETFGHVTIPALVVAALVTVLTFAAGYIVRD